MLRSTDVLRPQLPHAEEALVPRLRFVFPGIAALFLLVLAEPDAATSQSGTQGTPPRVPFRIPSEASLTDTLFRASALRGRAILLATRDSLPRNVGNGLRCASCHIDGGLRANAMPWVGAYARFPQYRTRSGKVDLIEDRINDCFERSMNGKPLERSGRDMRDIVTYFAFLSTGIPVGVQMEGQGFPRLSPMKGDAGRGAGLFVTTCARCHGPTGQGTAVAPPLWGPRSYNAGAGMARISVAASFIHSLMPLDRAQQLTPQQAFDVATYINTRPRPEFSKRFRDWPRGGRPPDADYHVLNHPHPQENRK
ncbi:MAG TPA: c-type cytochrome [Gemmatimonadaceae bacterium]|nr:c-type cytochrome [Gemmatimonadaceae bacterium]